MPAKRKKTKKNPVVDWGDGPRDLYREVVSHLKQDEHAARFFWGCISTGIDSFMNATKLCPHIFVWQDDDDEAGGRGGLLCYYETEFQLRWLVTHNVPPDLWPERARKRFAESAMKEPDHGVNNAS